MALRAGYYGIKNKLLKQLINIPAQIVGKADASLLATVQTELTASKAYAVGEQFVYNQVLYKVTQAIASGAAITIGTNAVVAGSVMEQIGGYINVDLRNIAVTSLDNLTGHYYGALLVECPTNAVPYGWCWVSSWETFGVSLIAQDSTHIKIGLYAKQSCTFPNPEYPKYIRIFYKIM